MNRERLRYRKSLRWLSFFLGTIAFVLCVFDWLLTPLLFPRGPWWLRLVLLVFGLLSLLASHKIAAQNKRLGKVTGSIPIS